MCIYTYTYTHTDLVSSNLLSNYHNHKSYVIFAYYLFIFCHLKCLVFREYTSISVTFLLIVHLYFPCTILKCIFINICLFSYIKDNPTGPAHRLYMFIIDSYEGLFCILSLLWASLVAQCKESTCNARDTGVIPGSGRSPGEANGSPLQYSCLGNPMDREAWQATVHRVASVRHKLVIKPPFFCILKS